MITDQKFKNQQMHYILTSKSNAPTYVELWPPDDGLLKPKHM
jgi:hypothetical protein